MWVVLLPPHWVRTVRENVTCKTPTPSLPWEMSMRREIMGSGMDQFVPAK